LRHVRIGRPAEAAQHFLTVTPMAVPVAEPQEYGRQVVPTVLVGRVELNGPGQVGGGSLPLRQAGAEDAATKPQGRLLRLAARRLDLAVELFQGPVQLAPGEYL